MTLHSTLPVAEHGMYEWFVYEPALDRMICPLMFSFAGDHDRGTLATAGRFAPPGCFPAVTPLMAGLAMRGVECHAFQSAAYTPGVATDLALHGSTVHPFSNPSPASRRSPRCSLDPARCLPSSTSTPSTPSATSLGPDSPEFDAEIVELLDGLERLCRQSSTRALIVTADHGMTAIDPATTVYVNREWPELTDHLKRGADGGVLAPGGSARDLFLHVRDDADPRRWLRGSSRCWATAPTSISPTAAGRRCVRPSTLRRGCASESATCVVLPHAGESVWWYERGRYEQRFRGHHGGASADEMRDSR